MQTSAFVFGLESDIQITGQKGDALSTVTLTTLQNVSRPGTAAADGHAATLDYAQKLPWFGTLRGQIGVTPVIAGLSRDRRACLCGNKDQWHLPGPPGGACFAPCTPTPGAAVAGNFSQTKTGWVVARAWKPRSAAVGPASWNISTSTSATSVIASCPSLHFPSLTLKRAAESGRDPRVRELSFQQREYSTTGGLRGEV